MEYVSHGASDFLNILPKVLIIMIFVCFPQKTGFTYLGDVQRERETPTERHVKKFVEQYILKAKHSWHYNDVARSAFRPSYDS